MPLLVASHPAYASARVWARGKRLRLCGYALTETYSVLTRLPGDARLSLSNAVTLIDANFDDAAVLDSDCAAMIHRELADCAIAGGAAYDGVVGLAARTNDLPLATRDARARGTYEAIGATVEFVG